MVTTIVTKTTIFSHSAQQIHQHCALLEVTVHNHLPSTHRYAEQYHPEQYHHTSYHLLHDGHDNCDKNNYFSHTQHNEFNNVVHGLR